ncbi:MAG: ATP-binding protein [Coleofasciculaceae cyanobacterium SM2_1_6]|nr:ATP-binding protein [Coleofasciculaceae cyanobacterium SM2_1_6]
MALSKIIKEHKLLLGATAILSIGSVVAACATGGASIAAIPILAGFSSSLLNSMAAANLGDLAKRLRDSSQVLTNEDLAKAAGRAIALGIQEVIRESYPELAGTFRGLVDRTEGYWLGVDRSGESPGDYGAIEEGQLRYAFAAFTGEGDKFQTLDLPSWQKLVQYLMEQERGHLPAGLEEYQDFMAAVSKKLHEKFPFYLREVLKQDASQGGKAFSGMVLDLLRDNIAQVNQVAITQQNMIQLLQQLDTGIRDELAQIRESFQQYFDLTKPQLPLPQACEAVIQEKTQDFVGRRYVFEAMQNFVRQQPKGYFILEADPGVGKSAIMARCVQLLQGRGLTHFNIQSQGIIRADQFLENICTQLIQAYGLKYPKLPENTTRDGNVLAKLLGEASQNLPRGQKIIIVVDALDEVDLSTQTENSNVLYLPDALPENVYFILSKRPQALPMPLSDYQVNFDLMQYPAESAADARHYVERRLQHSPQIQQWVTARSSTQEEFLRELVGRSANNFMYLRYVLNDIRDGLYRSETLDSLPRGLQRYYQKHWQLMGMNDDPDLDKIHTIYVLSEVREPVSRRLLVKLTGVAEPVLRKTLEKWEQFLRLQTIEKETRYAIYHASFSDFLNQQVEDLGFDLGEINRRIAENLAEGAPL